MQKIEARNKEKLLWEWQQLQLSCTLRKQTVGTVPWVGANNHEERQRLQNKYQSTMLLPGGREELTGAACLSRERRRGRLLVLG